MCVCVALHYVHACVPRVHVFDKRPPAPWGAPDCRVLAANRELAAANGVQHIVAAMARHVGHLGVQKHGCWALHTIAASPGACA